MEDNGILFTTRVISRNLHDYNVEGIVVFRAFTWPFQTFFSNAMVDLMIDTYKDARGLVRRVCNHRGAFYMNGNRQTCQASSTMCAPNEKGTENQYYNPRIVNAGLVPLLQSFINILGNEAQHVQQSCGQFMLHILGKTLNSLGSACKVFSFCKNIILSLNFFSSIHKDCDGMSVESSKHVRHRMQTSPSPAIKRWLNSYDTLFGEESVLPLPTTCCWYPLRRSKQLTYYSFFMILDSKMAYDLSGSSPEHLSSFGGIPSDRNCFGATFFGSLINHGTSAPLWVDEERSLVTIVCPEDRLYNAAWGRSGGSSEETKVRLQQKRQAERAARERDERAKSRRVN